MMRIEGVIAAVPDVAAADLADWIARAWVMPGGEAPEWVFSDGDLARVRLVRSLRVEIGIELDAVPVVLSLLDQVHALQGALTGVLRGLENQPEAVRAAVLGGVSPPSPKGRGSG